MKRSAILLSMILFSTFVRAGNESADAILDLLNSRSLGSQRRYEKAASLVAAEAEKGYPLQQYVIAVLSSDRDAPRVMKIGEQIRDKYLEKSRPKIKFLAERGNPLANYLMYLEMGDEELLSKALEGGNVQAMNTVGTRELMKVVSNPTTPSADAETMRKCFDYFQSAASKGDANGWNNMALCLQNGYGCERDEKKAMACMKKAAEMRHPEAINNLGRYYREGIVVEKDLNLAFKCFETSAEEGSIWGKFNYAMAILRGEGTKQDAPKAVKILELIAGHNCIAAMDVLADVYDDGAPGVEADYDKSLRWTLMARAERGDKAATKWIEANRELDKENKK